PFGEAPNGAREARALPRSFGCAWDRSMTLFLITRIIGLSRPFLQKLERASAGNLLHRQRSSRDLKRHLFVNELVVETDRGGVAPGAGVENAIEPGPVNCRQTHRAGLATGVKFAAAQIETPEGAAGFADRHHFGVRGGIEQRRELIV